MLKKSKKALKASSGWTAYHCNQEIKFYKYNGIDNALNNAQLSCGTHKCATKIFSNRYISIDGHWDWKII